MCHSNGETVDIVMCEVSCDNVPTTGAPTVPKSADYSDYHLPSVCAIGVRFKRARLCVQVGNVLYGNIVHCMHMQIRMIK